MWHHNTPRAERIWLQLWISIKRNLTVRLTIEGGRRGVPRCNLFITNTTKSVLWQFQHTNKTITDKVLRIHDILEWNMIFSKLTTYMLNYRFKAVTQNLKESISWPESTYSSSMPPPCRTISWRIWRQQPEHTNDIQKPFCKHSQWEFPTTSLAPAPASSCFPCLWTCASARRHLPPPG